MKPEWRTSTVVKMCSGMRQTRDYSVLPILADALQDAGCDDEELLANLRSPPTADKYTAISQERLVAIVYSEESEAAVNWMHEWAKKINYREYPANYDWDKDDGEGVTLSDHYPHTYCDVMQQAHKVADGEESGLFFGTVEGADYFRGPDSDERTAEFFSKFTLISGVWFNTDNFGYASCAC